MGKWYAVVIGRIPGFYTSWPSCQAQVRGYKTATYKSFLSKKEAALWMLEQEIVSEKGFSEQLNIEIRIAIHGTEALKKITSHEDFEGYEPSPFIWKREERYILPTYSREIKEHSAEFFQLDRQVLDAVITHPDLRTLVIYCDGSKMSSINHLGSGVYCRFNGHDYGMSLPFNSEIASKYLFTEEEIELLSSPTMEYIAFSECLWHFISIKMPLVNGIAYPLAKAWRLLFVSDFQGVRDFTHGGWKPKESHIIKIHEVSSKIIKFLKDRNIHVEVRHCDGHEKVFGNEYSDLYAKHTEKSDNLDHLVNALSLHFEKEH